MKNLSTNSTYKTFLHDTVYNRLKTNQSQHYTKKYPPQLYTDITSASQIPATSETPTFPSPRYIYNSSHIPAPRASNPPFSLLLSLLRIPRKRSREAHRRRVPEARAATKRIILAIIIRARRSLMPCARARPEKVR